MATGLSVWHPVDAPASTPYPYGLFSVVQPISDVDVHTALGVRWESQACIGAHRTIDACLTGAEAIALDPDGCGTIREFDPFTVYSFSDESLSSDPTAAHPTERLLIGEQYEVEAALWEALDAATAPVAVATGGPSRGLAYIEARLRQILRARGVIHVSPFTATLLADELRVESGRLVTTLGTPVVVGGGYDPVVDNALPATVQIIGSGPLYVWRSPISETGRVVDLGLNQQAAIAQRSYVVGWDCGAVAVSVTL